MGEQILSIPSIAVIIAAYNEEEGIGATLTEIMHVLQDQFYLVVDGNSIDRTVEIAKELGIEVLAQKGQGKGCAISQAIRQIDFNPDYVVFIDADFTYPSKYIMEMVRVLDDDQSVGMVLGNRFNHLLTSEAMKNPFFVGNKLLTMAHHAFNGIPLNDPLTGLRVIRWDILKEWKPKSEGFDIEVEMNYFVKHNGYKIHETPIPYRTRLGDKKLKIKDGLIILRRIISQFSVP